MKSQTAITIMRITEVIAEATDHIGVNKAAQDLLEDLNKGKGDNKIIIWANIKITMDNLTPPTEDTIITIIMIIIKAEVDVAMVVIITEVTAVEEVVIEVITITNTINITHRMIVHRWSNMAYHAHSAVALITLQKTV